MHRSGRRLLHPGAAGIEPDGLSIAKLTEQPIPEDWNEQRRFENEGEKLLRRDYQRAAVAATGVAYWDLTTWPCNIVAESGKPLGWFNRDAIHNNDHGKQLIGHTLAAWFRSAKKGP